MRRHRTDRPRTIPTPTIPAAALTGVLTTVAMVGLSPAAVAAQGTCGIAPGVGPAAGFVHFAPNGGTSGFSAGVDGALDLDPYAVQVSYRRMLLDGESADPDIVRATAAYAVMEPVDGIRLCAVGHAGATRFSFDEDTGFVVAGGVGARLVRAVDGAFQPFLGVRGLGARAAGTVLGLSVDAAGLSLGVEAGGTLRLGSALALRFTGTIDGFDDGLGVTPYPGYSAELALDYRF